MHYQLGLSAPNPDAKDFSRKVLWNPQSFAKIILVYLREVLLPTFLIRKVGLSEVSLFLREALRIFSRLPRLRKEE